MRIKNQKLIVYVSIKKNRFMIKVHVYLFNFEYNVTRKHDGLFANQFRCEYF